MQQQYLLIPAPPTPNGPLHLGHIAGPFLRSDILARHFRQQGHHASIMSGSDIYDSFVLLKATQQGLTPEQVIRCYHQKIKDGLQALDITLDDYVDLLDPDYHALFLQQIDYILNSLQNNPAVIRKTERILFDNIHQHYIFGGNLLATCPHCHKPVSGQFCEACGGHFRPDQLKKVHARDKSAICEWHSVRCDYIEIPQEKLQKKLQKIKLLPAYFEKFTKYITQYGNALRLSHPGEWGINYSKLPRQVIFSYAVLLAHCLTYGALYQKRYGLSVNALKNSTVTTIAFTGSDIMLPCILSDTLFGSILPDYKGIKAYYINEFYTLETQKFSTSRQHAIWANEIIERTPNLDANKVRYYLSQSNLTYQQADFSVNQFLQTVNEDYNTWLECLQYSFSQIQVASHLVLSSRQRKLLKKLWDERAGFLLPETQRFDCAFNTLKRWQKTHMNINTPAEHYGWLLGCAILSYPFVPQLACTIWHHLGGVDIPTWSAGIALKPSPKAIEFKQYIVTLHELHKSLPVSLRQSL